jgi:hypothetical protein
LADGGPRDGCKEVRHDNGSGVGGRSHAFCAPDAP